MTHACKADATRWRYAADALTLRGRRICVTASKKSLSATKIRDMARAALMLLCRQPVRYGGVGSDTIISVSDDPDDEGFEMSGSSSMV